MQCGLCASTCPEDAITLEPRLLLADGGKARAQPRVLNEAEPFCCVRCGKPFGTLQAIELMLAKLAGHAMFQGAAAERLKMCGDCRVIDIHSDPGEVRIDRAVSRDRLSAVRFRDADEHEELARAEVYGLLAQLFYAPPGDELHAQLRVAVTEAPVRGAFLERPGASWSPRARRLDAAAVADEYADAVRRRRQAGGLPVRLVLPRRLPQRQAAGRRCAAT